MKIIEFIKKNSWRRNISIILLVILLICNLLFTNQSFEDFVNTAFEIMEAPLSETEGPNNQPTSPVPTHSTTTTTESDSTIISTVDGQMSIHFIDVGQSDATLFIHNDEVMLFDAALASRGDELVSYLQELGIDHIDVLVLSHPHDDHMGGAAEVLNNISVDVIYGPDIFELMEPDDETSATEEQSSKTKTPGWYDDMIDSINTIDAEKNKGISEDKQTSIWHFPRNEDGEFAKFNIGGAVVEFLAPLEDSYSDKNDYSICAIISYGNIDIMMTADATSNVEKALIAEGYDLDVEIFHASHHGSNTGNSREFLNAMTPECVIISCGMKNRYNHPTKSVVDLYEELGIIVYRTDESGNIVMTTDGTTYSFDVQPGTYTSGAEYNSN